MELRSIAAYFDREKFDSFDPTTGLWKLNAFTGQLKPADFFVTIWHRPTRRRMLTTAPDQEPPTPVFRVPETGDIYLAGTIQRDANYGKHYRSTMNVQHAKGSAQIIRKYPDGAASNPGWDAEHVVQTTYIDIELRTQKDDSDTEYIVHGNYYLFTPGGSPLQDEDYVRFNGVDYWVEVVYDDSGYRVGRAIDKPDQRVNAIYTVVSSESYDDSAGTVAPSVTNYNVTMKLFDYEAREKENISPNTFMQKAVVKSVNLPNTVSPKIADKVAFGSINWRVIKVEHDALKNEWALELQRL